MRRTCLLVLLAPTVLSAQSVRVSGLSTARYIDVKPITTQQRVTAVPLTQDLNVNVWGFGTGLRVYAQLRGRAAAGDAVANDIWPQASDHFDVLAAYGELDRPRYRVRAGRQWKTSSLGFYNYDGASLLIRARPSLRAEVYGGWSLLAGESDDYGSAVTSAIEPFQPDSRRNIIGGELQLHLGPRVNASGLYQREILTDRAAIYSERAAGNLSVGVGRATLDGSLQGDLANQRLNQARLQVSAPLGARVVASVEARRYRPFFELWTIWGAFNPIGFEEALANARWSDSGGRASLHVGGGVRRYGSDGAGVEFDQLLEHGWRAVADATWSPRQAITLSGSYRADIGFGASRSQGDLSARMNLSEGNYVSGSAIVFQSANELQVRTGTVAGVGTDAAFKLSDVSRVGWSLAVYRHDNRAPADEIDWSQVRGSIWLEWAIGSNPDAGPVAQRKP